MDKIEKVTCEIGGLDDSAMRVARARLDSLTKPQGSLGRLEELAVHLAGITGNSMPSFHRKVVFTFAGDHGVVEEGVSAYPSEVTQQMVYNFARGGAAINVLARYAGAQVIVADLGVAGVIDAPVVIRKIASGTRNFTREPAMTREEAHRAIEAGIDIFDTARPDLAAVGDMGIGNTTSASAIVCAITGRSAEEVTGRGTGIGDVALKRKINTIRQAILVNRVDSHDPMDVLAKVGGFEIAGLVGVILKAASQRVPVLLDGFIASSAGLIACKLEPRVRPFLIASHQSKEQGHKAIFEALDLRPLLDLDMRLGEGTGAALAMLLVEAACRIINEMATFEEAGVSKKIS